jgi:cell division protein FtsA
MAHPVYKAKGSIFAALDIGSNKIACFVAQIMDDQGNFDILGIGHNQSSGIRQSTIIDITECEKSIRQAVDAAERMAAERMRGYPLREIVINVSGLHSFSSYAHIDVDISGHEITKHDITRALIKTQSKAMRDGNELIHTIPARYILNRQSEVLDPIGMHGNTLSMDVHFVSGDVNSLKNIASTVESSHLDIAALCSTPYASGLAALVEDEMDLGCTIIDLGGGVTSYAVFQGGNMVHHGALPVGGNHVTNDLAKGLTTSIKDAERIKTLYGNLFTVPSDDVETIDVPLVGEDRNNHQSNPVARSIIIGIMRPRVEEIFEMLRARLDDIDVLQDISRRVVLVGGGCQIPGLKDFAAHILDKQVRIGRPINISGLAEAVSGPEFCTAAGLLRYYSSRSHEMPARIHQQGDLKSFWPALKKWLHENW